MNTTNSVCEGNRPYAFVSYSYRDTERVEPLIRKLRERGFRIWYEDGINVVEWPSNIAQRISNSSCFVAFLSENYVRSQQCVHELRYALGKNRGVIPIYLEDVKLTENLDFMLSPIYARKYHFGTNMEEFLADLTKSALLRQCWEYEVIADPPRPLSFKKSLKAAGAAVIAAIRGRK